MSDFSFISTVILSSSAVGVIVCTRLTDQSVLIFYTRQYNIGGASCHAPKEVSYHAPIPGLRWFQSLIAPLSSFIMPL